MSGKIYKKHLIAFSETAGNASKQLYILKFGSNIKIGKVNKWLMKTKMKITQANNSHL